MTAWGGGGVRQNRVQFWMSPWPTVGMKPLYIRNIGNQECMYYILSAGHHQYAQDTCSCWLETLDTKPAYIKELSIFYDLLTTELSNGKQDDYVGARSHHWSIKNSKIKSLLIRGCLPLCENGHWARSPELPWQNPRDWVTGIVFTVLRIGNPRSRCCSWLLSLAWR